MKQSSIHDNHWKTLACQAPGARRAEFSESVQTLWSGYGEIFRVVLTGGHTDSLIIKHVAPPENTLHPRGWHSDLATQRKLKAYRVETDWYQH